MRTRLRSRTAESSSGLGRDVVVFMTVLLEEMLRQVREPSRLAVATGRAVRGHLDGSVDHLLLLGRHDERHDAREDPLLLLGPRRKKLGDLVCREFEESVQ